MKIIAVFLLTITLSACGDNNDPATESETDTFAEEYKAKVDKQVSESVVNSLVREWEISEEQVRCLLGDLRPSQLDRAGSDPAVAAVFDKCGVDPAVAD
jgi:hypothetical protein